MSEKLRSIIQVDHDIETSVPGSGFMKDVIVSRYVKKGELLYDPEITFKAALYDRQMLVEYKLYIRLADLSIIMG